MPITQKAAGAEVCREAYGAVLTQQGRGFYVTLELLAILWGAEKLRQPLLTREGKVRYLRRSHDFARQIMAGDDPGGDHLGDDETRQILKALLESLRVPIPNRRVPPGWLGQHLYPYLGELIHYDAAPRRGVGVNIERYTYRGAGGLAHKILRKDDNLERLEANRAGLRALVEDAGGALGDLALACASHDSGRDSPEGFIDEMEEKTRILPTAWVEHLRNGVRNIVSRDLVRAKKVELLMHWVPYCIARHQLDCALAIAGEEPMRLPISLVGRNTSIRQVARREFDRARSAVETALGIQAKRMADEAKPEDATVYQSLVKKQKWQAPYQAFFTQTLSAVGALNAHTGLRHMTLQLPLLEAFVNAALPAGSEAPFEEFCDLLSREYGLVAGPNPPDDRGPLGRIDALDFRDNAQQVAADLEALGLLTSYSDATRMVHGEVI